MIQQFELAAEGRDWIHLVWGALLVIGLCAWGISRRSAALAVFGLDPSRARDWLASLRRRRWRRSVALALAIVFLAAAAVQPRANPERSTRKALARDIVVILDVSRSMLADDLKPSRLERAKLELKRLAESLEGDRIALIVFAGESVIKCPLTSNTTYFKNIVDTVGPLSVDQGGTRIGDAIRKALSDLLGVDRGEPSREKGPKVGETVLEESRRGEKPIHADVILITDGEDHDSYPVKAAERAAQFNVGIYAIGLGSEEGTPIPILGKDGRTTLLKAADGTVVQSRLDSRTLQDMVLAAPRGRYLPVGTYNFDLVDFFRKTIDMESVREVYEEHVVWTEIFQPFLIAGLILYLVHILIPERPRRGQLTTIQESP